MIFFSSRIKYLDSLKLVKPVGEVFLLRRHTRTANLAKKKRVKIYRKNP